MRTNGNNRTILANALAAINTIATELLTREQATANQQAQEGERITRIEKTLNEIKEAILESPAKPKTWAQVASQPANIDIQIEMAKHERREKIRKEQAKTALTLSLHATSKGTREEMSHLNEQLINNMLRSEANFANKHPDFEVTRLTRISPNMLKIQCKSEPDIQALKEVDWNTIFPGTKVMNPTYGVVLHGVPKHDLDIANQDQAINQLKEANKHIKIARIAPLIKNPRNPSAPTHSIIVFMETADEADRCIAQGMIVERRYFQAGKYAPATQIKQCFRCQTYGHKTDTCTRPARCGKCGKDHSTKECTEEQPHCAHCKGPHTAWSPECPRRQKETNRLKMLRTTIPITFSC